HPHPPSVLSHSHALEQVAELAERVPAQLPGMEARRPVQEGRHPGEPRLEPAGFYPAVPFPSSGSSYAIACWYHCDWRSAFVTAAKSPLTFAPGRASYALRCFNVVFRSSVRSSCLRPAQRQTRSAEKDRLPSAKSTSCVG